MILLFRDLAAPTVCLPPCLVIVTSDQHLSPTSHIHIPPTTNILSCGGISSISCISCICNTCRQLVGVIARNVGHNQLKTISSSLKPFFWNPLGWLSQSPTFGWFIYFYTFRNVECGVSPPDFPSLFIICSQIKWERKVL